MLVRANAVNAHPRRLAAAFAILVALALPAARRRPTTTATTSRVDHIVVIYQENHSFDNLYGRWEGVRGLRDADRAHTRRSTSRARRSPACCRTT